MRFYGNEICCGSYACLNAMQDPSVDLQLFEISTSVPFGIRHDANQYFDRMLTTYCDPNQGIERALQLWGYNVKTYRFFDKRETENGLRLLLQSGRSVVIGPIDMGCLAYQIIPSLLKRMDHYILVTPYTDKEVYFTDSDGFLQSRISLDKLGTYLSVDEIPEAMGSITVRQIQKKKKYIIEEILEQSVQFAADNFCGAESCGQGSGALRACGAYLQQNKEYQWRLPLMYDLQYLKQRKILLLVLLDELKKRGMGCIEWIESISEIVEKQNVLLGSMYIRLRRGEGIAKSAIDELADMEYALTGKWEHMLAG